MDVDTTFNGVWISIVPVSVLVEFNYLHFVFKLYMYYHAPSNMTVCILHNILLLFVSMQIVCVVFSQSLQGFSCSVWAVEFCTS